MRLSMKAGFHINVVIFFEFLMPMVVPLLFGFIIRPDISSMGYTYLLQVFGLYFLGRIIGRNIPANCSACSSRVTPRGTSLIIYHCKKCGYKYSKRVSGDDFHNDNNV